MREQSACARMRRRASDPGLADDAFAATCDRTVQAFCVDETSVITWTRELAAECGRQMDDARAATARFPLGCLATHGLFAALSRRGLAYGWTHELVEEVAAALIPPIVQSVLAVDSVGNAIAAAMRPNGPLKHALEAARATEEHARRPYVGCGACAEADACHYRVACQHELTAHARSRFNSAFADGQDEAALLRILTRTTSAMRLSAPAQAAALYCAATQAVVSLGAPDIQSNLLARLFPAKRATLEASA